MERQRAAGGALAEPAAARDLRRAGLAGRLARPLRAAPAALAVHAARAAAAVARRPFVRHILHVAAVVVRYTITL